jgi:hypothetical protein
VASSIYIPLPAPTREALVDLAAKEYRRPRDQARLLLEEGLRQRGALQDQRAAAEAVAAPTMKTPPSVGG